MANRVARGIITPNVLEYLPISEDYTICELAPPAGFIARSAASDFGTLRVADLGL